ncbi:uncharacterized protein LOC111404610 [Olea europaea var. sylvestris]|uniref:uncharacterized protein LOC111404610 n=1 Tax=Olea europaea var. sylvestris TaxID=158386 RepID=UPI000C1CF3A7|nr:uncharacterized protein LOC111404610 [Olea europaea var. sylvestris]
MKDLGSLSYFLGLEVSPTTDDYSLTQAKYTSDLLTRTGLTDCKIADSPLEPNIKLRPTDGEFLPDATRYRQLVGSLIYLIVTRPDIAYVVHLGTLLIADLPLIFFFYLVTPYLLEEQKQTVVARSSTEAECRALVDTTSKLLWLGCSSAL